MSFGKSVFGNGRFGGGDTATPVIHTASPLNGAVIDVSARRLRVRLTSEDEGVGININTLTRITINGLQIFNGTSWIAAYANSYFHPDETGDWTVVILRTSDWLPGTTYYVVFSIEDNAAEE